MFANLQIGTKEVEFIGVPLNELDPTHVNAESLIGVRAVPDKKAAATEQRAAGTIPAPVIAWGEGCTWPQLQELDPTHAARTLH